MPAISIADLNNAKRDVDHIAAIATSRSATATDRLGQVKRTLSKVIADLQSYIDSEIATVSANGVALGSLTAISMAAKSVAAAVIVATDAARVATVARDAVQLSDGVYRTIAEGLAATVATRYFSTPSPENTEYLILYRHDLDGEFHSALEIQRYPSVAGIEYTVANTLYVKSNGSDLRAGTSWRNAFRTIEKALEAATVLGTPTLIEWAPENPVYTRGHLDMPDNCVIKAVHRTVFLRPVAGFEERNVFRMGSGCFLEGVMFEGFRVDSLTNPTEGFAVSFRPGAVIVRVPYAHKIAVRSIPSWGLVAPPLDFANGNPYVPRGGGVVLADGLVCSQRSIFTNIMTWGATPVVPNGVGYCAKNGALINAVNAISMWAHRHFMAISGGQIILSSCSTQFGDYSLYASGSRNIVVPAAISQSMTAEPAAAALVQAYTSAAIETMWAELVAAGYTASWTMTPWDMLETTTRSDAALLLQCLDWALSSGNQKPMQDFAAGMFNVIGESVITPANMAAVVSSHESIKQFVLNIPGMTSQAKSVVEALFAALASTLTNTKKRTETSRITAIGHTWTAVMGGVALTKLPPAINRSTIQDSIVEANDGVVIASGQDDQGNALFVGGLEINADTGELGGPPFDQAVRRIATRTSIARSF